MTEFIIIRHGQTKLNGRGLVQGHLHGELDEVGLKQAEAAANAVGKMDVSAIYSSDLDRALMTAEYIQRTTHRQIVKRPGLRERCYGIFEGLSTAEIKQRYPNEYRAYKAGSPAFVIPDGESLVQTYDRAASCMDAIAAGRLDEKVVVVTHAGVLDCVFRRTLNIPLSAPRNFKLYNGSINVVFAEGGRWVLGTWGDIGHLHGIGSIDLDLGGL